MKHSPLSVRRGFTLIELLLVIGIIAILASIVIVAINPTKQLADARNAQRRSDVQTIINAVYQYAIDNNGALPGNPAISTTVQSICKDSTSPCTNGISLRMLSGTYVVRTPIDPSVAAAATGTNYTIVKDTKGRVTVNAPGAENSATINVTR
jgi:type IV pilus assembly protein PilA